LKILEDSGQSDAERAAAATALGKMKAKEAVPALVGVLYDGPHIMGRAAARALVEIGHPPTGVILCKVMQERKFHHLKTRETYFEAIVKMNNPESFGPLFEMARIDPVAGNRQMAADALDKMMGTEMGLRHDLRVKWVKKNRPEWKPFFTGKVGGAKTLQGLVLFYAAGLGIAIFVLWFVWSRFL
jgi:hypothetical protein